MTDLERVLEYARAYAPQYYPVFKDAIDAHRKEDAAREEAGANFKRGVLDRVADLEAELARLREENEELSTRPDWTGYNALLDERDRLREEAQRLNDDANRFAKMAGERARVLQRIVNMGGPASLVAYNALKGD